MTIDEATVAMNKALPVCVTTSLYPEINNNDYIITEISRIFRKWDRTKMYTVAVSRNQRVVYHVGIEQVSIQSGYENVLAGWVKQLKKDKLRASIKELVDAGGNKTTITKLIKEIIDDIKSLK